MAIVAGDDCWCPGGSGMAWATTGGGSPVVAASGSINTTGDRVAWVIQPPKSGVADWFEVRLATVGNTPDNGLRFSWQDLDLATGNPDGVVDQFADTTGVLTSGSWITPANAMTDDGTGGGVKRTLVKGTPICCVIDFASFTASDSLNFTYGITSSSYADTIHDYFLDGSSGTYVKQTNSPLILAIKYADGTYARFIYGHGPWATPTLLTFNNTTAVREMALRFQVLTPRRVTGYYIRADIDATADVILYDSDGSTLRLTDSLDPDARSTTTQRDIRRYFDTTFTLLANTTYYLSFKPTSASNVSAPYFTLPSATHMQAAWGGAEWYLATRDSGGTWTPFTDQRPLFGLCFDGFDDGAGAGSDAGGGGKLNRGLN